MASTFSTNLGLEKPTAGEQEGTWGSTVNETSDRLDQAIGGQRTETLPAVGDSSTPNDIEITNDGTTTLSTAGYAFIDFDDGGDLGGTAYVRLTPNTSQRIIHVRNSLTASRSILFFQGTYNASNDYELKAGEDALLKFDGAGSGAVVSLVQSDPVVNSLTLNGVNIPTVTAFAVTLLDDATAAAAATTLGLGTGDSPTWVTPTVTSLTLAGVNIPTVTAFAVTLLDDADAAAARVTLGVSESTTAFEHNKATGTLERNGARTIVTSQGNGAITLTLEAFGSAAWQAGDTILWYIGDSSGIKTLNRAGSGTITLPDGTTATTCTVASGSSGIISLYKPLAGDDDWVMVQQ